MKSNYLKLISKTRVIQDLFKSFVFVSGLVFAGQLFAAKAKIVSEAGLKAQPKFSATTLENLQPGLSVEILKREGGWYHIQTEKQKAGWVTLLQLRFEPIAKAKSPSALSKFVGLRKGHSNVTATTGVRGINEQDIMKSKGDFIALEAAKVLYVTEKEAKLFAQKAKLTSQSIDYRENNNEK